MYDYPISFATKYNNDTESLAQHTDVNYFPLTDTCTRNSNLLKNIFGYGLTVVSLPFCFLNL